jgi:hypothetical protein
MSDDTPAAGSGGEGSGTPDTQAPEVRALIREAVDQEVAGLKATNANLKDEKRALAERVKTADGRIAELETLMQARDEQLGSLVVDDRIRDAAAKAGLIASATEDALHRGRQVFALDREGRAVARDGEGAAILGADGKSPLSPAEWLEGMRETAATTARSATSRPASSRPSATLACAATARLPDATLSSRPKKPTPPHPVPLPRG